MTKIRGRFLNLRVNTTPFYLTSFCCLVYKRPLLHCLIIIDIVKNIDYSRFNSNKWNSYSWLLFLRFSWQLELRHCQLSSTNLLPKWVNGSSSSVLDVFMRLDQYKRQLLSGVLCINMDLQGSFESGPASPEKSHPSMLAPEGLTMSVPPEADSEQTISSS